MGYALVFSGQGRQHPDMLPWLARDPSLVALERELGADWRERLADPAAAGDNRRAQLLLTATACAAWSQLQGRLPPPAIVAGYSVGELPAFAAAGVFDASAALSLAATRADCMDAAAADAATGLFGVTGATAEGLAALCERFDLEVAIRIDAGSVVLGGLRERLLTATAEGDARGWHCTPLNVSLASHTRWMRDAVGCFDRALADTTLQRPARPLASNALGRVRTAAEARTALTRQIAQTVRWDECMDLLAAQRVQAVLEIGPGQALARLWNDRHGEVPARSVDEFRSIGSIVAWIEKVLAPG
ncbi:(acyl-carrier-protein) S-malonyltransferase [Burkholderiales bacterium JOSHI_001]|nr:(acyl-carrier-protein) S-malonyltransferase [Burkholderiales bacterium JOSHI_001]